MSTENKKTDSETLNKMEDSEIKDNTNNNFISQFNDSDNNNDNDKNNSDDEHSFKKDEYITTNKETETISSKNKSSCVSNYNEEVRETMIKPKESDDSKTFDGFDDVKLSSSKYYDMKISNLNNFEDEKENDLNNNNFSITESGLTSNNNNNFISLNDNENLNSENNNEDNSPENIKETEEISSKNKSSYNSNHNEDENVRETILTTKSKENDEILNNCNKVTDSNISGKSNKDNEDENVRETILKTKSKENDEILNNCDKITDSNISGKSNKDNEIDSKKINYDFDDNNSMNDKYNDKYLKECSEEKCEPPEMKSNQGSSTFDKNYEIPKTEMNDSKTKELINKESNEIIMSQILNNNSNLSEEEKKIELNKYDEKIKNNKNIDDVFDSACEIINESKQKLIEYQDEIEKKIKEEFDNLDKSRESQIALYLHFRDKFHLTYQEPNVFDNSHYKCRLCDEDIVGFLYKIHPKDFKDLFYCKECINKIIPEVKGKYIITINQSYEKIKEAKKRILDYKAKIKYIKTDSKNESKTIQFNYGDAPESLSFDIELKNIGENDWPSDAKLDIDKSNIYNDFSLGSHSVNNVKSQESIKIENITLNKLNSFPPGNYKVIFAVYTKSKMFGDEEQMTIHIKIR